MNLKPLKNQHGYLLLMAVILTMIIGFLGVAVAYMSSGSSSATINLQLADQAFYIAESGLEISSRFYLSNAVACTDITSDVNLTNATLGNGRFTVTGNLYSGSTTLSAGITNTATSITVASTATFAPSGFLTIDSEAMTYAGITGNTFTGILRGYNNTTPATHNINATVTQNQCVLTSTAGIPNLTSPRAKRILVKNISPQSTSTYYAVGDSNGTNLTILRYTGTTWVPITPAITSTTNLLEVYLSSATTGWASGNNNIVYQLNGTTWTAVDSGISGINNALFCSAPNNCVLLGDTKRTGYWNGTAWVSTNLPGGTPVIPDINGVFCTSSSNCWAVGANTATKFFQGTGATSPLNWVAVSLPALTGYTYNSIYCNSPTDCWAVGANATFARRSGSTWSNYSSLMPATKYNDVFCTSASNCWAVGNSVGTANTIVQWNGTSWVRYTATNPIPSANFNGLACASSNDCWAVGGTSTSTTAFIRYDGSTWSAVSPANMPSVILRNVSVFGSGSGSGSAGAGSAWITWYEKFS